MSSAIRIIGSYLSPYVRKVLVVLELKGLDYTIDPIVPFFGDDAFSAISPLRRIPVLVDDALTISDSTVICEYLEERHPAPAVMPRDPVLRAKARWLEEYADTRLGDVLIWRLFNQVAIRPAVWGEKGDKELLARTIEVDVPQVLDYLETQAPAEGFLFGAVSVADISIACFFRNAEFARVRIDAARWPRMVAFVDRVQALEPFVKLRRIEDAIARVPIAEQRRVLAEVGAPLTPESVGTPVPRRGLMPI